MAGRVTLSVRAMAGEKNRLAQRADTAVSHLVRLILLAKVASDNI